jgi:hypothetical protein
MVEPSGMKTPLGDSECGDRDEDDGKDCNLCEELITVVDGLYTFTRHPDANVVERSTQYGYSMPLTTIRSFRLSLEAARLNGMPAQEYRRIRKTAERLIESMDRGNNAIHRRGIADRVTHIWTGDDAVDATEEQMAFFTPLLAQVTRDECELLRCVIEFERSVLQLENTVSSELERIDSRIALINSGHCC